MDKKKPEMEDKETEIGMDEHEIENGNKEPKKDK